MYSFRDQKNWLNPQFDFIIEQTYCPTNCLKEWKKGGREKMGRGKANVGRRGRGEEGWERGRVKGVVRQAPLFASMSFRSFFVRRSYVTYVPANTSQCLFVGLSFWFCL